RRPVVIETAVAIAREQLAGITGGHVHHVERVPPLIEVSVAVETIEEVLEYPRRIAETLLRTRLDRDLAALGIVRAERDCELAAVRGPLEGRDGAVGETAEDTSLA